MFQYCSSLTEINEKKRTHSVINRQQLQPFICTSQHLLGLIVVSRISSLMGLLRNHYATVPKGKRSATRCRKTRKRQVRHFTFPFSA